MLTCKQASQLVSQSLDRPLSWRELVQLRFHLLICNACRHFKQQLNQLLIAIEQLKNETVLDQTIQLSTDAKTKILQVIESNP
ncbi:MAG: zf-HC2 domain-containing protein [Methylotenera sp.]|nr:zf-HC2 domain-containing protein [Methylotenera sp.]MDD4925762.1 zf-HC2 domain-containing protein [Methylotenera sp.]NOS96289.1 zf-HC2 domain-containing protein [Methylotenera sp.]NOU41690.1 zf-HC2 domain-containing protein [Methylotenera sp.]